MVFKPAAKIVRHQIRDITRSRWVILYALFFLGATETLLRFSGGAGTALLGLARIALAIVPLVSIVFGTIYLYHSRAFVELLLAQPIARTALFWGLYAGLSLPLCAAFVLGIAVPMAARGGVESDYGVAVILISIAGVALTLVFVALAFCVAIRLDDRLQGLSASILFWLLATVMYDGLILALASAFRNYPLEFVMLAVMAVNPVDLARILLLLNLEVQALSGYTGALLEQFFGSTRGAIMISAALLTWVITPLWIGQRQFERKDF